MLSELHTECSMAGMEPAVDRYRQSIFQTVQRFRGLIDLGPLMDDIVEITMEVEESDSEQSSDHDDHDQLDERDDHDEQDSNGNANDIEVIS